MVSESEPVLPTFTLPKLRLVGLALSVPVATAAPVPDNGIDMPALLASELMIAVPVTEPLAIGEKVTVKVVVLEAARITGVVIPLSEKPAPPTVTCETEMLDEDGLLNVTTCDLLEPIVTLPKDWLAGFT